MGSGVPQAVAGRGPVALPFVAFRFIRLCFGPFQLFLMHVCDAPRRSQAARGPSAPAPYGWIVDNHARMDYRSINSDLSQAGPSLMLLTSKQNMLAFVHCERTDSTHSESSSSSSSSRFSTIPRSGFSCVGTISFAQLRSSLSMGLNFSSSISRATTLSMAASTCLQVRRSQRLRCTHLQNIGTRAKYETRAQHESEAHQRFT